MSYRSMTGSNLALKSSSASTMGRRGFPASNPARLTAYLMGMGFVTQKRALNMGSSLRCSAAALQDHAYHGLYLVADDVGGDANDAEPACADD